MNKLILATVLVFMLGITACEKEREEQSLELNFSEMNLFENKYFYQDAEFETAEELTHTYFDEVVSQSTTSTIQVEKNDEGKYVVTYLEVDGEKFGEK